MNIASYVVLEAWQVAHSWGLTATHAGNFGEITYREGLPDLPKGLSRAHPYESLDHLLHDSTLYTPYQRDDIQDRPNSVEFGVQRDVVAIWRCS